MVLRLAKALWARKLGETIERTLPDQSEPTFPGLVWQLCTAAQTRAPEYLAWCDVLNRRADAQRRKVWEYCYILQALQEQLGIAPGLRGLGFGIGKEQLPAVFASRGIDVLATDQSLKQAKRAGWVKTQQHATGVDRLQYPAICSAETLRERVKFRVADMNAIPDDLREFDFVWSTCSLEHLGTLEHGMRFVLRAMDCLRPGGVALHTTEYNLVSNQDTIARGGTVLFRKRDLEELAKRLGDRGFEVLPLNLHPGFEAVDHEVDVPPFRWVPHMRLLLGRYATTSVGIVARKPPRVAHGAAT